MIKSNLSLSQIKNQINNLKEKPLKITINLGRNKYIVFTGKLEGVYSALFTVKPFDDEFKGKTSYSYAEYMCGRVTLNSLEA